MKPERQQVGVIREENRVLRAEEILLMSNRYPKAGAGEFPYSSVPDYYDRLRDVTACQQEALFRFKDQTVDLNGTPEKVVGMIATPSLLQLLQVPPVVGRTFTDDEGEIGAEQKVILSYGLWKQMYAGARDVAGKQVRLNGRPYTIVGVMPADFSFVNPEVRLWVPAAFTLEEKNERHSNNWYNVARLKPGATLQQAQAQVDALNAANLERFPQWKELLINAGFHTQVQPLRDMLVKDVRSTLYLLWGGAVFVLLIGGVNLANLALARLTLRKKEFATRLALGVGRAQNHTPGGDRECARVRSGRACRRSSGRGPAPDVDQNESASAPACKRGSHRWSRGSGSAGDGHRGGRIDRAHSAGAHFPRKSERRAPRGQPHRHRQ